MSTDSYGSLNPHITFLTVRKSVSKRTFSFVAEPLLRPANRGTKLAAKSLGGNAAGFCGELVRARHLATDPLAFKHSACLQHASEWTVLLQMENAFSDFEIIMHSWKL